MENLMAASKRTKKTQEIVPMEKRNITPAFTMLKKRYTTKPFPLLLSVGF